MDEDEYTFVGRVEDAVGHVTELYVHSGYGCCGAVVTEESRWQHVAWHVELDKRISDA